MKDIVRTRFAPSPTGYMHIGNLRTALYTFLYAKHNDGKFILRIEDTDQNRFVEGATEVIYNTLKATNLIHDEGPDKDGGYGPYIQSERKDIYKKYALELVEKGYAYFCFCKHEENEDSDAPITFGYNRHCRNLTKEEIQEKLKTHSYCIRQKMPLTGTTTFYDELFGEITVDNSSLDDQILLKSDGMPTYNFANVVDDHLMNITHVMRGKEYISSTPKYQLLYEAFGWTPPKTVHLSVIMGQNPDGSVSKLSKRHGAVSFAQLVEDGYLIDAILNYIALLGWSPRQEREIFSLQELIEIFDIEGLNKSDAVFDYKKLDWMNSEYIKKMDFGAFFEYSQKFITNLPEFVKEKWQFVATLVQSRIDKFTSIEHILKFLWNYTDFDLDLLLNKKNKTTLESSLKVIEDCLPKLKELHTWTNVEINNLISEYCENQGIKLGFAMWPLRIAVSAQTITPGGTGEIMYILGKEESLKRLEHTKNRLLAEIK